ncbi:hypothetical protein K438DRAFT_1756316 [Mycena galopus ATCC 62051]|nr:hypothetical protein K438DRAFT_1756316 [Mycena galopus ATCC 62051]
MSKYVPSNSGYARNRRNTSKGCGEANVANVGAAACVWDRGVQGAALQPMEHPARIATEQSRAIEFGCGLNAGVAVPVMTKRLKPKEANRHLARSSSATQPATLLRVREGESSRSQNSRNR